MPLYHACRRLVEYVLEACVSFWLHKPVRGLPPLAWPTHDCVVPQMTRLGKPSTSHLPQAWRPATNVPQRSPRFEMLCTFASNLSLIEFSLPYTSHLVDSSKASRNPLGSSSLLPLPAPTTWTDGETQPTVDGQCHDGLLNSANTDNLCRLLFSNPVWAGASTVPTTIIRNITALSVCVPSNTSPHC